MSCVAKNPAKELTGEAKWDGLINIVYAGESDPLAAASVPVYNYGGI